MMKMSNFFPALILLNITGVVVGFSQNSNVSSGGDASGSGGTASYSIGQVSCSNFSNSNGSVNEGVQQPYEIITLTKSNTRGLDIICSVFPNPVTSYINLKIETNDIENISYQLFDMQGKLLTSQKINSQNTLIPMENFASAGYFLKLKSNNKEIKSYKIIKN